MKIARALLAGASLLAPGAWAGEVSGVSGTLDTTLVDPAPAQYPHFICAAGCSGGGGGNFNGAVTQSGDWTVGVSNFPATQAVTGTVNIGNLPATQPVTGTVGVNNFPATQAVTGAVTIDNLPATQAVTGTVGVSNFPATQAVTGTVSVGNFPDTQAVSATSLPLPNGAATAANQPALEADGGALSHVTNFPATQAVTGTVGVSNFPSTQAVTGTVSVGNFPLNQAVTGTVSVGNFPLTQSVSAASLPLPTGAATAANQPTLNADGGALAHVTNFPSTQSVTGSVSLSASLPSGVNHLGSIGIDAPLPGFQSTPTFNVGTASDGWNPTEGSTTDPAWTSGAGSLVALLKANVAALTAIQSSMSGPTPSGNNQIGSVSINLAANTVQPQGFAEWQSTAAENCHAYGSPATVYSLGGYANQAEWVLVYNTTTAPADGAVTLPVWWYYIAQPGSWSVSWTPAPRTMATGDTVCYSSTGPFTKTTTGLTVGSNSFFGQRQ